jgi:hypothetical protein
LLTVYQSTLLSAGNSIKVELFLSKCLEEAGYISFEYMAREEKLSSGKYADMTLLNNWVIAKVILPLSGFNMHGIMIYN